MQTLHGIDISTWYGLNYLRLCYLSFQRETSLFLECGWQAHTLFYGEVSLCLGLKPFLFHQRSWWLSLAQATQNKSGGRFLALRLVDFFNLLGFGGDVGIEET